MAKHSIMVTATAPMVQEQTMTSMILISFSRICRVATPTSMTFWDKLEIDPNDTVAKEPSPVHYYSLVSSFKRGLLFDRSRLLLCCQQMINIVLLV
jgi:hypothetical protein